MRLHYSPDPDAAGGEPVSIDAGAAVVSDWDGGSILPDEPALSSLKGKTAADLVTSYGELRGKMDQQGKDNAALKTQLDAAKKVADGRDPALDAAESDMVGSVDFQEVLDSYIGSGEVTELFMDVITTKGMIPTREDVLGFLEYKKWQRANLIEHAAKAASDGGEEVKPEHMGDVIAWMNAGHSSFSKAEIETFNSLGTKGNWTWIATIMDEFNKAGGPAASGNRYIDAGQKIRGRAVSVAGDADEGFRDAAQFQAALNKNRDDPTKNIADKQREQRRLIALREATR